MAFQDPLALREQIINFLKSHGPSLPVHISKETGLSILFSSAFLSELLAEKEVRISNIRVGNSPVYFLPGQENMLENFSQHLKSREKDAYLLLKEKKILKDSEQQPAIRVALREIKDYAVPVKSEAGVIWKFFTISEDEFAEILSRRERKPEIEIKQEAEKPAERIKMTIMPQKHEEKKEERTEEKEIKKEKSEKTKEKKKEKKKPSKKKNEKFFEKVKEFISKESIEILDINGFDRNELSLIVRDNKKEFLVVAFNKKKILEQDIIKAHKKASEKGLKYRIIVLNSPVKKMESFIEAAKEIDRIDRIE